MDYEKAYKEALERAREIHNEHRAQCFDVMVKVFPELKESEDERIRKAIIQHFKTTTDAVIGHNICSIPIEKVLAWLEKQSEQKSSWSEEDEEQLDRAIYMMEQLNMTKSWDDVYNWLKSLKERIKK